jgi:hypothetical protein
MSSWIVAAVAAVAFGVAPSAFAANKSPAKKPPARPALALVEAGEPSAEREALREHVARLHRAVGGPTALFDIVAIAHLHGSLAPQEVLTGLQRALERWRQVPAARSTPAYAALRDLTVDVAARAGSPLAATFDEPAGRVTAWRWLGPFGNEHGSALDRTGEVELEAAARKDQPPLRTNWPGREGEVGWRPVDPARAQAGGVVAFDELVERPGDALVYAEAWLQTPQAGPHTLLVATDGPAKVWLDGQLLGALDPPEARNGLRRTGPTLTPTVALPVQVANGAHRLLVKLAPRRSKLRLKVVLSPVAVDAELGLPWPPDQPAAPAVRAALFALAWHGWPLAPTLRERLLAAQPDDVPHAAALAHALLPSEPGDRIDRLRFWQDERPADRDLLVQHAKALDEAGKTAAAHRLWTAWTDAQGRHPEDESVRACLLRSDLWARLQAPQLARTLLNRCDARWPGTPDLLDALVRERQARDQLPEVHALLRRLVELEPGVLARHEALLQSCYERGDQPGAEAVADAMRQRFGVRARPERVVAELLLIDGLPERAKQALDAHAPPADAAPRSQDLELGARVAVRLGDRKQAETLLERAAALAPARADLRARLLLLRPDVEFYASQRRDLVALCQREQRQPRKDPLEVRRRHTVIRLVGNGQQARYDAEVVYLGPGAPNAHEIAIDYAPSLARADVIQAAIVRRDGRVERQVRQDVEQLGDDASGMYFDQERITLRFSGLHPGDAVVAEWVVRDLGPTPFGLVFGELLALGDVHPVREVAIAVQVPDGTPLYWDVGDARAVLPQRPEFMQRALDGKDGNGKAWDEWRLTVHDVPATEDEERMPGASDVLPYLHVSSFASWTAAAAWYAGLMASALPARGSDAVVRDLALKLTAGSATVTDKVRALHAFAAQQVRYVGLEFGIHSLKPHAVREVIQRRFGDCKDKATLLVALCAEAGIAAQVVLVRSLDQGRLHDKVASLGGFNHAIAYVPALGWYLDATAPHHGPLELPEGDMGGTALPIPAPDGLLRLPEAPAEANVRQEELAIDLQADGSATVAAVVRLSGLPAAEARTQLWSAEKRRERLEQEWSPRLPGVQVVALDVAGVEPVADEVVVRFTARVPKWAVAREGGLAVVPCRAGESYAQLLAPRETRQHDVVLARTLRETTKVILRGPPGWQVVKLPVSTDSAYERGQFALTASRDAGAVVIETELVSRARTVPVEDYAEFRTWLAEVDAALRGEVVWVAGVATAYPTTRRAVSSATSAASSARWLSVGPYTCDATLPGRASGYRVGM